MHEKKHFSSFYKNSCKCISGVFRWHFTLQPPRCNFFMLVAIKLTFPHHFESVFKSSHSTKKLQLNCTRFFIVFMTYFCTRPFSPGKKSRMKGNWNEILTGYLMIMDWSWFDSFSVRLSTYSEILTLNIQWAQPNFQSATMRIEKERSKDITSTTKLIRKTTEMKGILVEFLIKSVDRNAHVPLNEWLCTSLLVANGKNQQ